MERRASASRRLRVLLLVSSLVPGCSLMFAKGPPAGHEQLPAFPCTTSYAAPVVDTLWGGLAGVNVLGQLAFEQGGEAVGTGLVFLGLAGASAIYGYSKVGQCRDAQAELKLRGYRPPLPHPPAPPPRSSWDAPPFPPPSPPAPATAPPWPPPTAPPPDPPPR